MNVKQAVFALGLSAALFVPATAAGQETTWYAGGGLAVENIRFEPYYTVYNADTPSQFDDRATGRQVNLMVGQRVPVARRVSLGWQATLGVNGFHWTLSLPEEPARLEYSTPFAVVVSAVPEVDLGGGVSVFGAIGVGTGRVHELKTSLSTSAYDYNHFRPVGAFGAGVRIRVMPPVNLFGRYDWVRYASFGFDTFDPAGVRIEHVRDAPRPRGATFGVLFRF